MILFFYMIQLYCKKLLHLFMNKTKQASQTKKRATFYLSQTTLEELKKNPEITNQSEFVDRVIREALKNAKQKQVLAGIDKLSNTFKNMNLGTHKETIALIRYDRDTRQLEK